MLRAIYNWKNAIFVLHTKELLSEKAASPKHKAHLILEPSLREDDVAEECSGTVTHVFGTVTHVFGIF